VGAVHDCLGTASSPRQAASTSSSNQFAACLTDYRNEDLIEFSTEELLLQRMASVLHKALQEFGLK